MFGACFYREEGTGLKIDRLLGVTFYLLNHGRTSAAKLAEKFEVSLRTIQRDIDTLCAAGIPIASAYGADGGYEIMEDFKVDRSVMTQTDHSYIITALNGLVSAYGGAEASSLLEKFMSSSDKCNSNIVLDFSVLKEKSEINENIKLIQTAISRQRAVQFDYTNADGIQKICETEPVATVYKWYSWYLLGFCRKYGDYRLYKLTRIENLREINEPITQTLGTWEAIAAWEKQGDIRNYWDIKLLCDGSVRTKCTEYLNGCVTETFENGDFIMQLHVPDNEHFWYGSLLALGDNVKVLEPPELQQRIVDSCRKILDLYRDI